MVLEISVLMARIPSREIAQLSYSTAPWAGLRQYRRALDDHGTGLRQRGGPRCGALTAIMTGVAYATS
jgi:ribonucleoside-diphosphate reductase alpha chain